MKNIKFVAPILALAIFIILIALYNETICDVNGCNNKCVKNGKYCIEHTCEIEGCVAQKSVAHSMCYYHFDEHIKNYEDDNKIILTDSQIKEARAVVDNYIELLMSKQPNILGINIINDTPETSSLFIKYSCNVVREDDDTNLATIYVSMDKDGKFEVNSLEYE